MKRKKTVSKYTLYLTTGNVVEILADEKKELNTEEATEFWRDNHYVGKFNNNSFLGFTREDLEDANLLQKGNNKDELG